MVIERYCISLKCYLQVWFHYDKDKNGYLEYVEFCQFMKDLFVKKDTSNITAKEVFSK